MKTYTVIGYYESTGGAYSMPQRAINEITAMHLAALACDDPSDLCIIGAIEGVHCLVTPGCDNDRSAFAVDLLEVDNAA